MKKWEKNPRQPGRRTLTNAQKTERRKRYVEERNRLYNELKKELSKRDKPEVKVLDETPSA